MGLLLILEFHDSAFEVALPLAHRHLALARASGVPTLEGLALQGLAAVHLAVMDHETGLPVLAQACTLMAGSASADARHHGYANTVYAQYAAGRGADPAHTLQAWLADCGPPESEGDNAGRHQVAFAPGQLASGALSAADAVLGSAPHTRWIQRTHIASWYWARGWLLLAQGRADEAQAVCHSYLAGLDRTVAAPMPLDAVQLQEVLRAAAEARGDWQAALHAAKALRDAELPLLRVHARVRFLTVQWQLQAQGHATDAHLSQQRLAALERSIARHEAAWTFDIEPLGAPAAAATAQSRHLACLGHEIRTPLSGLVGLTDLLLRTPLDEKQHKLVSLARVTADRLMRLLNDLLDLAKIEAGHLRLQAQPLSVEALAREAAALAEPLARLRRLDFQLWIDPDLPDELVGDRTRLGQELGNLLNNALKFTSSAHIRLAVHGTGGQDPVGLRLEVSDTGRGIPPALRPQLFSEFAQDDRTAAGGTGLGLAICRQLVEAMGGRIGMSERPGGGTIFWVALSLPRSQSLSLGATSA